MVAFSIPGRYIRWFPEKYTGSYRWYLSIQRVAFGFGVAFWRRNPSFCNFGTDIYFLFWQITIMRHR